MLASPSPEPSSASSARQTAAWPRTSQAFFQPGDLFHNFRRFPARSDVPRVDRLARLLRQGLLAPSMDTDQAIPSDLRISITGTETPYDSVIFLHRFKPQTSGFYLLSRPGHCTALINAQTKILEKDAMGENWPVLCLDEVYVKDPIPPEKIAGLIVHPLDANQVIEEFQTELRHLALPLFTLDGEVLWPKCPA